VRLDESLKTLADSAPDKVVLADIAFRHGFTSAAQFSRAFRARFGRAPRDILAMRKANPKAQLYRAWVEARRAQSDYETIDAWLASVTE
jgi:AraC-like DNA-binding protein